MQRDAEPRSGLPAAARSGRATTAARRRISAGRRPAKPAALGGVSPGIDLDNALARADAIEDQELARKMQLPGM